MANSGSEEISLKQIKIFLAAAEYDNFSTAAERLHITQPLVSQTISQMERGLGYPVFERDKKRVRLNKAGAVLRDNLTGIFALIDGAVESGRQTYIASRPALTISAPMFAENERFIFPAIPRFAEVYPDIKVKVDQMEIGNAVSRVVSGTIDLAFTVYPEFIRFKGLPIEYELIGDCLTYADVPPSSPLYDRSELVIADLVDEPLALVVSDGISGYTEPLMNLFAERGLKPSSTYYVSSTAALEVTSVLGEGIVLGTGISPKKRGSSNHHIPIVDVPNGIIAYWRSGVVNPMVRAFVKITKELLDKE